MIKCEKCFMERDNDDVKRRTFWPTRKLTKDDIEKGAKIPKWIKTQEEMCEECFKALSKALEGVI